MNYERLFLFLFVMLVSESYVYNTLLESLSCEVKRCTGLYVTW